MAESRRTAEGRILAVLRGSDELELGNLTLGTLPEGLGTERKQAFDDLCASKIAELMETDLPSSSRDPEDPPPGKRPRLD